MNKAPKQIIIARRLGTAGYVILPEGATMSMGYVDNHTYYHKEEVKALADRAVALEGALSKCLDLLDMVLEDHGKGKDWGEEDAFRMGEMFEDEDIAAVRVARDILKGF